MEDSIYQTYLTKEPDDDGYIEQYEKAINYFMRRVFALFTSDPDVTREAEDIRKVFNKSAQLFAVPMCVAGGAPRDYFAGERVRSDFDLFFSKIDQLSNAQNQLEKIGAELIFENDNVYKYKHEGMIIDVIKRKFENVNDMLDHFDFTVSTVAVTPIKVTHHPTFFMDLAKRALVTHALPEPLSTLSRVQKYIKKGFTMCTGGMLSLSKALAEQFQDEERAKKAEDEQEEIGSESSTFGGID